MFHGVLMKVSLHLKVVQMLAKAIEEYNEYTPLDYYKDSQ